MMLKIARRAVLRQTETKYISTGVNNFNLYHNGTDGTLVGNLWALSGNLLQCGVGTAQNQRLGDEVFAVGLSLKMQLICKNDRPNCSFRVMLITTPPDQAGSSTPSGLWKGATANRMLDYVDTDKYKILYSRIFNPPGGDFSLESGATNREHLRNIKIWLPLKMKKIKYSADGGTTPMYQGNCISLVVVAYDTQGSIGTDNIALANYVWRFYFKDP